jgi:hypothetical protein
MRVTSLWVPLAFGLTACASSRVVTTLAPVPAVGSPIRYALRSAPHRFASGRMISLDADTLTFERLAPDTLAFGRFARGEHAAWATDRIPTDSIARLQVQVGRHSNAGRGTLIGGGIGLALGTLCAMGSNEDEMFAPSPGQCVASGIVSGALTGLLIGALSRTDVWAPVPLPTRGPNQPPKPPVAVTVEPDGGIAP